MPFLTADTSTNSSGLCHSSQLIHLRTVPVCAIPHSWYSHKQFRSVLFLTAFTSRSSSGPYHLSPFLTAGITRSSSVPCYIPHIWYSHEPVRSMLFLTADSRRQANTRSLDPYHHLCLLFVKSSKISVPVTKNVGHTQQCQCQIN